MIPPSSLPLPGILCVELCRLRGNACGFRVGGDLGAGLAQPASQLDNILDVREHDVPYHVRVAIDCKINVGHWYHVRGRGSEPPDIRKVEDEPDRPVSHTSSFPFSIPPFPRVSIPRNRWFWRLTSRPPNCLSSSQTPPQTPS